VKVVLLMEKRKMKMRKKRKMKHGLKVETKPMPNDIDLN